MERRALKKRGAQVGKVNLVKSLVVLLIQSYRATRSWRLPRCRFYPSCSSYALSAVKKHGVLAGGLLTGVRLVKCQPLHPGGVDEVPAEFEPAKQLKIALAGLGHLTRKDIGLTHRKQT
jgi:uncharacterized protein